MPQEGETLYVFLRDAHIDTGCLGESYYQTIRVAKKKKEDWEGGGKEGV